MNKPVLVVNGTNLEVTWTLAEKVDGDGDGKASVEVGGNLFAKVNGFEVADELLKSSSIGEYIRKQLGL